VLESCGSIVLDSRGIQASEALVKLAARYDNLSEEERREQMNKVCSCSSHHLSALFSALFTVRTSVFILDPSLPFLGSELLPPSAS
jgi:hypothetical protein